MIFEIDSTLVMGGVAGYTFLYHSGATNDHTKIQRIAANTGLIVKEGRSTRTIHLLRRTKHDWGAEYVYRIPLGLSFTDFKNKRDQLQDGLNNKTGLIDISFDDIKQVKLNKDILN